MEQEMEVLYIEDLASHGGPESCVGVPRGRSEALTGGRAGWAIEPRNRNEIRGADVLSQAEGDTAGGVIASRWWTPRGRRTRARTKVSMRGNREIPRSSVGV